VGKGIAVRDVRPVITLVACLCVQALACLPVLAQVLSPSSRTARGSTDILVLQGYALSPGQKVKIEAVDQNTGNLVTLDTVSAAQSGNSYATSQGVKYKLYPWTYKPGTLAANYWAPQSIVADLATSQGHLELRALIDRTTILPTFSQPALSSLKSVLLSSHDFLAAAKRYTDGNSTVLFDQDGVGSGPATPWVSVQGMISNPSAPGFFPVAWSVGYYTVEGGKKIFGLICAPTTGGPNPVVIYNHGGTDNTNGGNINGVVTAAGWTSLPPVLPDSLGQCLDWAKRGWVFATSAYRGENVNITSSSPKFPAATWTSDGNVEFCMGEVTDVMALTDLVVNHASSITVGSASQQVALNVNGKVLMYGYSHGGCITYRAVEQGAPVTAFSVIEGFTDLRLTYLTARNFGATPQLAAIVSGAFQPGVSVYLPDANGVMGYNWRSAHYFASRGDLSIQKFKTMPILILHGDVDVVDPPTPATINPVPLAQPAVLSADIGATNIFVGPAGVSPPTSQPCIDGPVGAPLPAALTAPNKSCQISFLLMNTGDPCFNVPPPELGLCQIVQLPLAPPPGQPQQLHYLVVYHAMNHVNGGLAIKETFIGFVEQTFTRKPGCDGLTIDCATD
jgi:dienelactone hydrolase